MAEANLPPERDVKDFKFQQLCKVRVTNSPSDLPKSRASLIVASSKYGLTFIAVQNGFKVFRTSDFVALDQRHALDRLKHIITDFPVLADVKLSNEVTHINLSADELTLAVAITRPDRAVVYLYDIRNFAAQVTGTVAPFHTIVGEGSKPVNDLSWNPTDPNLLIICYCTGQLDIYNGQAKKASLSSARAKCVCWSPKGKQLVVGRDDGTLMQYDPDLNEKRKWDSPTILTTASEAFDLVWLSTYSFLAAYISLGADCSEQPSLILIQGSKDGPTTYECFEDICYGSGEERERKYYFSFVQKWDMIVAGCSNAAEIGIVGKHPENKVWERWNLDDSSRAECPLTEEYVDTYPLGITVDFSSQHPIPLGEEKTHPASPILLILSTEGLIIPYYMMNMHQSAPALTAPVQALDTTGLRRAAGVPASPASQPQQGTVKNLFGPTTTQPASKPATSSAGFGFAAASSAGSAGFSFTGSSGVPASTDPGAVPKFGATFGQTGTTAQHTSAAGFSFTSGTGAPASSSKPDQSEAKPPLSTGFGTTSFAGSTNKSGANAGFSVNQSFGVPAAASGTAGFPTKTAVVSDAVPTSIPASSGQAFNFSTKVPDASAQTPGFAFAAKVPDSSTQPAGFAFAAKIPESSTTKVPDSSTQPAGFAFAAKIPESSTTKVPDSSTQPAGFGFAAKGIEPGSSSFSFKPSTGKTPTPLFGQATQNAGISSTFGQSAQKTTTGAMPSQAPAALFGQSGQKTGTIPTATTTGLLTFGKTPTSTAAASGLGSTAAGVSKPVPAAGKPVSGFTGQSSAFATGGKPLHKFDSQASDLEQTGTYVPKSPTGPPPPTYPVGVTRAQSPKYAPPPQYPSDVQDGGEQQEPGETTDTVDEQFSKSILDEIEHFNQELSEFRYKAVQTNYVVGTKDDMKKLKQQTQEMDTFCTDIKATVQDQNKEVQDQRALCLDMFSMVEECRMRQHMNIDPKYLHLQKSRALDPGSAEKLQQLQLQYQVLDQGLRDVDLILDTQWEEYQNRKKNRTNRVQNPTNDAVYRVVKSNHNLILAQKNKLKELEERLKQLKLYNKTSAWDTTTNFSSNDTTTELSNLADTLLSGSPVKPKRDSSATEEKNVNRHRLERLREHLCRRNVSVIRSTKPGNLSVLQIPDRQLETSVFQTSRQQLSDLRDVPRSAGNFVGQFKRIPLTTNTDQSRRNRAGTSQTEGQTVRVKNERNKQEQVKEKADKDGKVTGFFKKIIEKGEEKVGKLFPPKSQANPTVSTSQGSSVKPPVQQVAIPKTVQVAVQEGKKHMPGQPPISKQHMPGQQPISKQHMPGQQPINLKVKELNDMKYEDITPSGSENDIEDTEEDDEYDEESSGSNSGEGFGLQYSMHPVSQIGNAVDLTPVTVKAASKSSTQDSVRLPSSVTTSTPVGRKLFTAEETKRTTSFNFGGGGVGPSSIKFGADTATTEVKTKPAYVSKPFTFTPSVNPTATFSSQSETGKPQTGFNFSMSGTPSFGAKSETQSGTSKDDKKSEKSTDEGKPTTGQITGLFGKGKPPAAETGTPEPKSETPAVSKSVFAFGQSSATSTSSSMFGQSLTTSAPGSSLFGQPISTPATSQGLFGQPSLTETSVIGQPSDAVTSSVETTNDSGEATPQADSSTPFGNFSGQVATSTTEGTGLFGHSLPSSTASDSSDSNLFGQLSTVTATTTTASGVFEQKTDTTSTSGLFGQAATSSAGSGLFGKPVSPATSGTTSSSGISGQATPAAGTGLFGQATTTTPGTSLFGQTAATTSGSSLFGQTTTTTSGSSLFGQTTTTTSGSSLFGQTTTTTTGTSLFGQTPLATSAAGGDGLFGQTTTTTASAGLFGQLASSTNSGGLFGQTPSSGASFTSTSGAPFGQTTTSSSGGFFGQQGGPFGQTSTSVPSGLFGNTSTSTGSGLFGQATTTASSGVFGQTPTSTGAGLFGSSAGSGFGTATSGSGFGFGQTASPGFGKPSFGQSPGFGQTQSPSSPFGQSNDDSGGGGLFGGLGGKPSAEKANTNVFGVAQPFGTSQSNTQGLFGSGSSQTFGSGAGTGGGFSSGGTFSTGTGVAATGFGAAKQQTGTGGFGSAPAFGSGPSFGGTPAFGSSPGFGSPPAFGGGSSPGAFGSAPAFGSPGAATFGSVCQEGEGAGFAGFAEAGSPTFGGLAQTNDAPSFGGMSQSPNPGVPGFGGNTGNTFGSNPAFSGYRG